MTRMIKSGKNSLPLSIHEKEQLLSEATSLREKLREWIRVSYAHFDRHPEGFTYVFLTPRVVPVSERGITRRQGELFVELIRRARDAGEVRPIEPATALSHFTALMLNVPRLINEGTLEGPASAYTEEVWTAVWRVLRPDVA